MARKLTELLPRRLDVPVELSQTLLELSVSLLRLFLDRGQPLTQRALCLLGACVGLADVVPELLLHSRSLRFELLQPFRDPLVTLLAPLVDRGELLAECPLGLLGPRIKLADPLLPPLLGGDCLCLKLLQALLEPLITLLRLLSDRGQPLAKGALGLLCTRFNGPPILFARSPCLLRFARKLPNLPPELLPRRLDVPVELSQALLELSVALLRLHFGRGDLLAQRPLQLLEVGVAPSTPLASRCKPLNLVLERGEPLRELAFRRLNSSLQLTDAPFDHLGGTGADLLSNLDELCSDFVRRPTDIVEPPAVRLIHLTDLRLQRPEALDDGLLDYLFPVLERG